MGIRKGGGLALLVSAIIILEAGVPAWAEATTPTLEQSSRADLVWRKLGRGIANIATCPAELIRIPEQVSRRDGYVAGITVGLLQGLWAGLVRGAAGIVEVGTFFVEVPENYGPLVQPEFVFAHGSWTE